MADYTRSLQTLLSHQSLALSNTVTGTAVSCADALMGWVYLYHANVGTTANASGTTYRIQTTPDAAGTLSWVTLPGGTIVTGTTAANQALISGSEGIGDSDWAVGSTTGFSVGQNIYVRDVGTLANSEWHIIRSIAAGTAIRAFDGLSSTKTTNDEIYNQAERYIIAIPDLGGGAERIRINVQHQSATGSTIHFKASVLLGTDIE